MFMYKQKNNDKNEFHIIVVLKYNYHKSQLNNSLEIIS